MRNLPCKRVQCDEIWAFCGSKEKNVAAEHRGELGYGDVYAWTHREPYARRAQRGSTPRASGIRAQPWRQPADCLAPAGIPYRLY